MVVTKPQVHCTYDYKSFDVRGTNTLHISTMWCFSVHSMFGCLSIAIVVHSLRSVFVKLSSRVTDDVVLIELLREKILLPF